VVRILLLLLVPYFALAQEVKVTARMEGDMLPENSPLNGTVTVEHPASLKVEEGSFRLQNRPLKTTFVKEVKFSENSSLRLSLYSFKLPPKEKGLYVLSPISVEVGGKKYSSLSTTYEVSGAAASRPASRPEATLALENIVEAPSPIYPGQRATFGYAIFYKTPFEIQEDFLPLLAAEGFRTIGSEKISDAPGERRVTQVVEAKSSGEYSFGPSYITGRAYERDSRGRQVMRGKKLRAEAPAVAVTVAALPKDAPPSFNGAIGSAFQFSTSLLSLDELRVGDKVELALKISGSGDLDGVPIPDLCCQPGFPGMFKESDLPPVPTTRPGSIIYSVLLHVLSDKVKAVPPIAFSYFDTEKKTYVTLKSEPIPLRVSPPLKEGEPLLPIIKEEEAKWPVSARSDKASAVEISSAYKLSAGDLQNRLFGGWSVFLVIPLGIIALYIVHDLKQKRGAQKEEPPRKRSEALFKEALSQTGPGEFFSLVAEALLLRLEEKGVIDSAAIPFRKLPEEGAAAKVRRFLVELEERRYAGKEELDLKEAKKRAEKLFEEAGR